MIATTLASETRDKVVPTSGGDVHVNSFIGDTGEMARGPQAFRSRFERGYVIDPHFHRVDQYQIFVGGSARMGKHPLDPVCVHYTDAFTPYGPIVVGEDDEMVFYNLRARHDVDAYWMPGAREAMERRAGRAYTATSRLALGELESGTRSETLIAPHDDGLLACEVVAAPEEWIPDELAGGSGRYELILHGSLDVEGRVVSEGAVTFVPAGDVIRGRKATSDGVHMLELQLPSA